LLNRITDGITGVRTGVHICRGNWSRREDVLLTGDYHALLPALTAMHVDQVVLEYATPRAGELHVVGEALGRRGQGKELGLGCVNPRTDTAEDPATIVARAEEALQFFAPEQVWLNPDCGFGCFASRCVNEEEVAAAKLRSMVAAARELRERHG
jgi:5-methyltetrahydropteroyltriglutamate--homocysteine methyltransferase